MTNEDAINAVMEFLEGILLKKITVEKEDIAYMDMLCDEMKSHEIDKTKSDLTLRKIEIFFDDLRHRGVIPPRVPTVH